MSSVDCAQAVEQKSELVLFEELYQLQNGREMSDEQRQFMVEIIESLKEVK